MQEEEGVEKAPSWRALAQCHSNIPKMIVPNQKFPCLLGLLLKLQSVGTSPENFPFRCPNFQIADDHIGRVEEVAHGSSFQIVDA